MHCSFIAVWIAGVRESKPPNKKKIGILQVNKHFTTTIEHMEKLMDRTEDAARWGAMPARRPSHAFARMT
jgi:hypothetical protein